MNELAHIENSSLPTEFHPDEMSRRTSEADAIIKLAQQTRNWPLLEHAVEEKISDQEEFVRWWDENVRVRHGGDTKNSDRRSCLSRDNAEDLTGISQQQVSRWRKKLAKRDAYRDALFGAAYKKAMMEATEHNHRAQGTGENEWYTPQKYLEAARSVLGEFDLDPASSDRAQESVRAKHYFTKETDGLSQNWFGRVWLNPPYARDLINSFASKIVNEVRAGRVEAAIALTHNYTDTAWFHEAMSIADAVCFTRGRIGFYDQNDVTACPTQGQAFFYYGQDIPAFAEHFRPIGLILTPYQGEV